MFGREQLFTTPPSNLDESSTLLPPPSNFLLVKHSVQNLQGAYLYFDKNTSEYIRSVKVTGRGFKVRHDEHQRKVRANRLLSDGSRFYSRYPSVNSSRCNSKFRKGHFENLQQLVACGFNPSSPGIFDLLSTDVSAGGVMFFDEREQELVEKVNFKGRNSKEKFGEMAAYHFELLFGLCLAPSKNVSQNPGFETCLGVW